MDVKDYSQKLDRARDQYRSAQEDLRSSYDKSVDDLKEANEFKINKLGKNYDSHKTKLEEQNLVNNQHYSDKTKETIAAKQDIFRKEIKKSNEKFDTDRNEIKSEFNNKLSNISDSYNKSTAQNNRYHDQASATLGERYSKANQIYKSDFDKQMDELKGNTKQQFTAIREDVRKDRFEKDRSHQNDLEAMRSSAQDQKNSEVTRLRNDNDNLRAHFAQEKEAISNQYESRSNDALKRKNYESEEGQNNFSNLQSEVSNKFKAEEQSSKSRHDAEKKALEKKFNEDLQSMKVMTNQKIKGGNEVSTLKEEKKQLVNSYEGRLADSRAHAEKDMVIAYEKEQLNDSHNRDKLKFVKASHRDILDKKETDLIADQKQKAHVQSEKTLTLVDRYKTEASKSAIDTEEKLSKANANSKNQLSEQRVEFGKYINNVNDKKMEEINSIKSELTKDKTSFIEKSRRDFSEEKDMMKGEFKRQVGIKENLYEQKLVEMEKQTNKIIENYENRIGQIVRKAEKEVDSIKSSEEERKVKEDQAQKIAINSIQKEHQMELGNIRGKYERMIGKDRITNEQQTTRIIQKYEDQLDRERSDHQKEISLKLSESQAQFERLYKASELEKETMRNQHAQSMENAKLASMSQENSKKS